MSLSAHATAAATSLKFPMVAVVCVDAVCFVMKIVVLVVVMSVAKQFHPVVADGRPITPVAAEVVPTLIVKAAVPFWLGIEAPVPKPDEIVGAVEDIRTFPLGVKVAAWILAALKFAKSEAFAKTAVISIPDALRPGKPALVPPN
jgi:hypothetical protein